MGTTLIGTGLIAMTLAATVSIHAGQTVVISEPGGAPEAEAPGAIVDSGNEAFLVPPPNDTCGGAIVIPDGPYPVLSAVTTSVNQATGTGDPAGSCSPAPIENGVWYKWTPAVGGAYTITTCSTSTATTDGDAVLAVFTSSGGCGGPFVQVSGACNDDACHPLGPSTISGVAFLAGTTYYILASHYPSASGGGGIVSQFQIAISTTAAPPNDTCFGAEVIPTGGPFPFLTTVVTATAATSDPDLPNTSCASGNIAVWYRFTPPTTGDYLFSTCGLDHGGTSTTTATTGIAIYTSSSGGCAGPFAEVPTSGLDDGCGNDNCIVSSTQRFHSTRLFAGTTYYVLVFFNPPNGNVQLRVVPRPSNDVCALATPLLLDVPIEGTTGAAADDYRSPSSALCYPGIGQTYTNASGRDAVLTFTAPTTDTYSFRLDFEKGMALYLGDCYGGPAPVLVSCVGGANRPTIASLLQEAMCVFLRAGQQIWVYVDQPTRTAGSHYRLVATRCSRESEPNGTPVSASALTCGSEGSIDPSSDVDFFSLGAPAAGSRAYVRFDRVYANYGSITPQIRITDAVNTLQYSNGMGIGELDWALSGTPLPGGDVYVRVNASNALEPYQVFYTLQPPIGSATAEAEPNDTIATAQTTTTGYLSGQLPGPGSSTDVDVFRFQVCKGDTIVLGLDEDPLRNATPIIGRFRLYDGVGGLINTTTTGPSTSNTTPGVGLTANTPYSPGESFNFKAPYSGTYHVAVDINGTPPSSNNGDYLLSIGTDCQRLGTLSSDTSLSIADAPDPVSPGGVFTLTFTVANAGPSLARDLVLSTTTPPNTTFVSVSAPAEWSCVSPLAGGAGAVTCSGLYLEVGSKTIPMVVRVNPGTANGTIINSSASLTNCHADPIMANNAAATTTTVTTGGSIPAARTDCYASTLSARIHLLPSFHPGGCTETLSLTGQVKVWSSNPSDPGDGRDEVETVMGCYQLTGTSSTCGLGQVLVRPSTATTSEGLVKSTQDTAIYPADARFDLALALDTATGTFEAAETSRETTTLSGLPLPPSSTFTGNGLTHPLYDASSTVIGDIELLQQDFTMPTSCPCVCAPRIAMSPDKQTVEIGIPTAGDGVVYDLVRGQTPIIAPDWPSSIAGAMCAQSQGGPSRLDPLAASIDELVWYLSRDSALGANGSFNECPAIGQYGDRDADVGDACP